MALGGIRLTWSQIYTVLLSLPAYAVVIFVANRTILGNRIRAVESNSFLAFSLFLLGRPFHPPT